MITPVRPVEGYYPDTPGEGFDYITQNVSESGAYTSINKTCNKVERCAEGYSETGTGQCFTYHGATCCKNEYYLKINLWIDDPDKWYALSRKNIIDGAITMVDKFDLTQAADNSYTDLANEYYLIVDYDKTQKKLYHQEEVYEKDPITRHFLKKKKYRSVQLLSKARSATKDMFIRLLINIPALEL